MIDETEAGGQVAEDDTAQAVSGEIVSETAESAESEHAETRVRTIKGKNGGTLTPFNSKTGAAAARTRFYKQALFTRLGVRAAAEQTQDMIVPGEYGVMAKVAEIRAYDAMSDSKTAVQSARYIREAGWPKPENESGFGVPAGGALLVISPELIAAALARIRGE